MWLAFENVTKLYGPVIGVDDLSCRIGPGITGLLGANGAGKTTMLKLASGQLRPTLGRVLLGSRSAWSSRAKFDLGFSPELDSFYEEMTGREFVYTMARLYGFTRRQARDRTEAVLADVGMEHRAGRRIGGCSHGMRQRIKLAQAMVHDPAILLLDEPMAGIDPGGRRDIGRLLVAQAQRGKTILVSSHILSEVEDLTDSILMIRRGRVIAAGTLEEIRNLIEDQPFSLQIIAAETRRLAALLMALAVVSSVEIHDQRVLVRTRQPGQFYTALAALVLEHRIEITQLETLDTGADAVFGYLEQNTG